MSPHVALRVEGTLNVDDVGTPELIQEGNLIQNQWVT